MSLQFKMNSPIGELFLVASAVGLEYLFWHPHKAPFLHDLSEDRPEARILKQTMTELTEYFAKKRHHFTVPLAPQGTEFQKRVWEKVQQIPFGHTSSYQDIAKQISSKGSARAVGTANAKNPICLLIPCHRVISADGRLGGYSGGLNAKAQLLELEK